MLPLPFKLQSGALVGKSVHMAKTEPLSSPGAFGTADNGPIVLAEAVGFEPTGMREHPTGLGVQRFKPLSHTSVTNAISAPFWGRIALWRNRL